MQRVVRSTFVGLLAIAGLTACGDKVTVPQQTNVTTAPDSTVHSVTVSPAQLNLNVGDKATLAASVDAGAGVTVRTVTWSTSNAAVATVDANTGVVTAVAAGNATIIAKANANNAVQGAAAVTVAGVGTPVTATVTISSINSTTCGLGGCNSVPANLGNVMGQLDVTLNVDPGSQKLAGVDLLMNCNAAANFPATSDTVVATQNLSAASTSVAAEAAAAPVTLSFNTAQFNSTTGATAFKNGQCILKARARTSTGQQVASSNTQITLANADVAIGNITAAATATDGAGLLWNGGNVTVSVIPVFFTAGRTAATTTVAFEGHSQALTNTAGGAVSAVFVDANDWPNNTGATDIDNITDANAGATLTVSIVDASGAAFTTNPCGANTICTPQSVLAGVPAAVFPATSPFRLDTQKPLPGVLPLQNNTAQGTGPNGYVGANFQFAATSAAGFVGPDAVAGNTTRNLDRGGVDKVTVTFLQGTCGTCSGASTLNVVTGTSTLSETNTATTDVLLQITKDALGNADTAFANGVEINTSAGTSSANSTRFGVDKTPPTFTFASGPSNQASSNVVGGTGAYFFNLSDNLSGPRPTQLVAQTSLTAGISSSTFSPPAENTVFTNGSENAAGPCVVGRYNATAAAAGPNALPVFARDGTPEGFCTPTSYALISGDAIPANIPGALGSGNTQGYFTTEVIAVDQAGNQTAPFMSVVVEDATAPTVTSIDMPGSITGNSTATFSAAAADNVDIMGSFGQIDYNAPTNGASAINLRYAVTSGPGVAFDNVLTRSATVTPAIPNFIKNLQVNNGGGAVTPAAGGNATSVQVGAIDEVSNTGLSAAVPFAPAVTLAAGASSSFSSNFTGGFTVASNTAAVSDCPTTGCAGGANAANPTSATLTATAAGVSGLFNNPFSGGAVGIWYQTPASAGSNTWFFAGNAGVGSARDTGNGSPGVGNRFWDYVFTFTPPKTAPDGTKLTVNGTVLNVRAIGVNTNGDGMATPVITVTLTNP